MIRATAIAPGDASAGDEVLLNYDARHRRRIRMQTRSGKPFLLDLKSAVALRDGDCLRLSDGSVVRITASDEPVIDIRAGNATELVRIAWHLGNRHLPVQVLTDRLRILDDHVIADMVVGLGATVSRLNAPFQPEGGAYAEQHEHN